MTTGEFFHDEIWEMIQALKLGTEKIIGPIVQPEGLTWLQAYILLVVQRMQPSAATVGSLSRVVDISPGNASVICKKLAKDGFLQRGREQKDERVVSLSVTPSGRQAIANIVGRLDVFCAGLNDDYPEEKLRVICAGVQELNGLIRHIQSCRP